MTPNAANEAPLSPQERRAVLEMVRRRFGIRDSDYGASRIDGAVRRVLPSSGCADVAHMLAALEDGSSPRWLLELVEFLTVGETYFLRDPAQIDALRRTILPDAIARRGAERRLRMWSAGCSTGEEVYTLAILLKERELPGDWDVSLVGTDVNRESLRAAREGSYPAWSLRATPDAVRERYFEAVGGEWRLKEPLKRMARFAWANLAADPLLPPLNDADLITCRNVTIYFDDAATQRLYRTLIGALVPGGWLMLGPSDPLPADTSGLERVAVSDAVLWRRVATARPQRPKSIPPALLRRPTGVRLPRPAQPAVSAMTAELEAGLLALEAGSAGSALEWLRRATFRQPESALAHFALAKAYVALGDRVRAHAALLHTRRLLLALDSHDLVPGSESMSVETLRQTVATHLEDLAA